MSGEGGGLASAAGGTPGPSGGGEGGGGEGGGVGEGVQSVFTWYEKGIPCRSIASFSQHKCVLVSQ